MPVEEKCGSHRCHSPRDNRFLCCHSCARCIHFLLGPENQGVHWWQSRGPTRHTAPETFDDRVSLPSLGYPYSPRRGQVVPTDHDRPTNLALDMAHYQDPPGFQHPIFLYLQSKPETVRGAYRPCCDLEVQWNLNYRAPPSMPMTTERMSLRLPQNQWHSSTPRQSEQSKEDDFVDGSICRRPSRCLCRRPWNYQSNLPKNTQIQNATD
mmetsp:Transcript_10009/g.23843  ORF Transcript_10009/g.23843 Transcript_10009/m.23843 type:complete len:209 (+) Transcript_10009:1014-1640(+)